MRSAALFLLGALVVSFGSAAAQQGAAQPHPSGRQVWPSQPPKDCPFEPSKELSGILFTGRHSDYHCGDTWYPSWASDDNQYSPWTDGTTLGVATRTACHPPVTLARRAGP